MTPDEKQSELQRHRDILLATIDYLISKYAGGFVIDDEDQERNFYELHKNQVEKYYQLRRLDRLQQKLSGFTREILFYTDLNFGPYIKETTGYDFDVFEGLRNRVDTIVSQNEIRNETELHESCDMRRFYRLTTPGSVEIEKLTLLIEGYLERSNQSKRKRKGEYSEVVSRVEKDDIVIETIEFSTGPKLKHYEEDWIPSPDGRHKLREAQWDDGKQAATYVAIHFANGNNGVIYHLKGICPGVKAWWKDDATVVIETNASYVASPQHRQVRSFDEVIAIEYIEH